MFELKLHAMNDNAKITPENESSQNPNLEQMENTNQQDTTQEAEQITPETNQEETNQTSATNSETQPTEPEIDYSLKTREELNSMLEKLIESYPETKIQKEVREIKEQFETKTEEFIKEQTEKLLKEQEEQRAKALEEAEQNEEDENQEEAQEVEQQPIEIKLPEDKTLEKHHELLKTYSEKQKEFKQKENERRQKNLEEKQKIIAGIDSLINKPEVFQKTFNEFKEFQKQWDEIGEVPKAEAKDLQSEYNRAIEGFYNYVQINKELRDIDLKKNTEIKTQLCQKAEELLEIEDIMEAQKKLQKLHETWRETGPAKPEVKEELWERFKKPTSIINEKHTEKLQFIKKQQEDNLEAKEYLCEKAEEELEKEHKTNAEWKKASTLVQKYQELWNNIGYVPKQHNQTIHDRFIKACDGFFDKMRTHFEAINKERLLNLEKKKALLKTAEENKNSLDWASATKLFKNIQNEWKQIGPVPRKHSDKIWKQFRAHCNEFFDRKREFFTQRNDEEDQNLEQKKLLIQKIEEFYTETKEVAIENIKEFQRQWQEIGYVPIKEKENIIAKYNAAIDKIFEKFKIDKEKKVNLRFEKKIQSLENAPEERKRIEIGRLRTKIDEKEKEIKLQKNNLGFFANNKGSEQMKKEYQKRIKRAEREVAELKNLIKKLNNL